MTAGNFEAALDFVWRPGFDNPKDGPHTSPGDPGGLTFGGITEATWAAAVSTGLVEDGPLSDATTTQLSSILHFKFWSSICDELPPGFDLALFNGRMMTGYFPRLFQQSLGLIGADVDGSIGPQCLALAESRAPGTFLDSLAGVHAAYLGRLSTWPRFGDGWTARIRAANAAARTLAGVTTT